MRIFPFPDKVMSREELTRDLLFKKIPKEEIVKIADRAWDTGETAAREVIEEHGSHKSIEVIAKAEKLIIERINKDNVIGNVRYFSEYYSGRNKIILYMDGIGKWAKINKLSIYDAEELILSHEYFHYLECTKLGLTSRQYTIPIIKFGSFSIGKSGIRALSEIGAHGFSRTFYELRGKLKSNGKVSRDFLLYNEALNPLELDSRKKQKKFII